MLILTQMLDVGIKSKFLVIPFLICLLVVSGCVKDDGIRVVNESSEALLLKVGAETVSLLSSEAYDLNRSKIPKSSITYENKSYEIDKLLNNLDNEFLESVSLEIGSPFTLTLTLRSDRKLYLGYYTVESNKITFFDPQPKGFPSMLGGEK